MKRRQLLKIFGIAPAIILTPGLLMPVKEIIPGLGLAMSKPEGGDIIYDEFPDPINGIITLNHGKSYVLDRNLTGSLAWR